MEGIPNNPKKQQIQLKEDTVKEIYIKKNRKLLNNQSKYRVVATGKEYLWSLRIDLHEIPNEQSIQSV